MKRHFLPTLGGLLVNPTSTISGLLGDGSGIPPWLRVYASILIAFGLPWLIWPVSGYVPGEFAYYGILPASDSYGWYLGMAAAVSLLLLPVSLIIWAMVSWLAKVIGKAFRGTGSVEGLRRALSWSALGGAIPGLIFMLLPALWPPTFIGEDPTPSYYALTMLQGLMILWTFSITAGAISAGHRFNVWKGMATALAVPIILVVVSTAAVLGFSSMAWLLAK